MNLASAEKEKIVEICERNYIEFCVLFGWFVRSKVHYKAVLKSEGNVG
jgi:hypothetical protein